MDLAPPKNHFDGINEQGNLSYWEKIGDLDIGDGVNFPLIVGFSSGRASSSPYLGDGWILPLLESSIVQVDTKRFLMVLPDGLKVRFRRKDETAITLTGQGGWMAQLGQNTLTAWASCGWKIVFTEGKITSITTPQNQQLTYTYQNGIVKEIDINGSPLLNILTDSTGNVSGLSFAGKQIAFGKGQKPNVESINGQTVVGEFKPSLNKVILPDGTTDKFTYAVDSKLVPTLAISGIHNRLFSWDPLTRLLVKDGDWTYKVVPSDKEFSDAQITRIGKDGASEYWYRDVRAGQEITQDVNGTKITKEYFSTGLLRGQLRKIEEN